MHDANPVCGFLKTSAWYRVPGPGYLGLGTQSTPRAGHRAPKTEPGTGKRAHRVCKTPDRNRLSPGQVSRPVCPMGPGSTAMGVIHYGSVKIRMQIPWARSPVGRLGLQSSVLGIRPSASIRSRVPGARYLEPGTRYQAPVFEKPAHGVCKIGLRKRAVVFKSLLTQEAEFGNTAVRATIY